MKVTQVPALTEAGQAEPPQVIEPEPVTDVLTVYVVGGGAVVAKLAVTVVFALTVRLQVVAVPLQAPPQPLKVEPEEGVVVKVIVVPAGTVPRHAPGHVTDP